MARSVKVTLEADVGKYIPPVEAAKKATDDLDDKVKATNRDLDKTPTAAARAAAAMKLLGADTDGLRHKLNDVGPGATNSLELIEKKIAETRTAMKQFADDFNKTGSNESLTGLLNSKNDLRKLEGLQKAVSSALEDGAKEGEKAISSAIQTGGKEGSKSLLSSLQGVLSTPVLGPITVGAIAGAIAVSAPAIGAAISAAVIGGGGLSLIGLGIAGQIHSPAVTAAWGQFTDRAKDQLTDASSVFEPALVAGLHGFGDHVDRFMPTLERDFAKLAGPLEHLLDAGAGGFLDRLGPGLEELSSAAAPFIDVLASELPELGGALSQMFHDISANAPGAILFFHDLFSLLDKIIIATGETVGFLSNVYGKLREVGDFFTGHGGRTAVELAALKGAQEDAGKAAKELQTNMQVAAASIDIAGGKAMTASDQYGMLISQLNAVNNTADKVAGAMVDRIVNPMLQADLAANNFDKSLVTLGDTLVSNGGALSAHVQQLKKSETGAQQNKDAILAVVQANLAEYDSQIAVGVAASDAAAKYDQNTKALEDQLRAAGYTQSAIDGLIGKYRAVPDKVDTSIAIQGLTDAINDLDTLLRQINGLHDKTITIQEHVYTYTAPNQTFHGYALGGIRRAQVGMLIPPSSPGTVLTAEPQTGGEALIPLRGISQMRAAQLGQVAMGGYGLDVVPRGYQMGRSGGGGTFRHEWVFGGNVDSAFATAVMKLQRTGDLQITTTRV